MRLLLQNSSTIRAQAARAKLEQDLAGAKESLRSASKKVEELEGNTRISEQEAHRAREDGKRTTEELRREVLRTTRKVLWVARTSPTIQLVP